MKKEKFSIQKRLKSFVYAFNGFKILLIEEHNSRIHLFAMVLVTIAGLFFHISELEWLAIVLCFGMVFTLEIINAAIENMADFISPNPHETIKKVKDLAAAGVLAGAIAAVVVGLLIFVPKIVGLFFT